MKTFLEILNEAKVTSSNLGFTFSERLFNERKNSNNEKLEDFIQRVLLSVTNNYGAGTAKKMILIYSPEELKQSDKTKSYIGNFVSKVITSGRLSSDGSRILNDLTTKLFYDNSSGILI